LPVQLTGRKPVPQQTKEYEMKGRAIIPLVLGLGIGIVAVKMFFNVLTKAKGASSADTVQVVRAKIDIGPVIEITDAMVEKVSASKSLAPEGNFTDCKLVVGRVSSQFIPRGMPVVNALLSPKGTLPGIGARIPEGYRAVAVKVDEVVGVAGWLKPGSRVDVVAVMNSTQGSRSETVSRVILQNIEVIAVGQEAVTEGPAAAVSKTVTLLVRPEEVTSLHLASTRGTVRLAMRNQNDSIANPTRGTTDNDMLGMSAKPASGDSPTAKSFLSELFSKMPKPSAKATDKPLEASRGLRHAANVEAAAPSDPAWMVEIMAGPKTYEVGFDGQRADSRRVDTSNHSKRPTARSARTSDNPGIGAGDTPVPSGQGQEGPPAP
jgi:pilus assembly protein CpaB